MHLVNGLELKCTSHRQDTARCLPGQGSLYWACISPEIGQHFTFPWMKTNTHQPCVAELLYSHVLRSHAITFFGITICCCTCHQDHLPHAAGFVCPKFTCHGWPYLRQSNYSPYAEWSLILNCNNIAQVRGNQIGFHLLLSCDLADKVWTVWCDDFTQETRCCLVTSQHEDTPHNNWIDTVITSFSKISQVVNRPLQLGEGVYSYIQTFTLTLSRLRWPQPSPLVFYSV